jgi:PhnB protein
MASDAPELRGPGRGLKVASRMQVQTTLNFYGRTEEALAFYRRAIDAEILFILRFRESPDQSFVQPGLEEKIYHATFRVGTTELMASDCGCNDVPSVAVFGGFALVLRASTPEMAEQYFAALSEEGHVELPLAQTFFAPRYGIVVDRFGLAWKIMVESSKTA